MKAKKTSSSVCTYTKELMRYEYFLVNDESVVDSGWEYLEDAQEAKKELLLCGQKFNIKKRKNLPLALYIKILVEWSKECTKI